MRATRDLLRRRTFLVRRRAELLAHLVNTNSQYNFPPLTQKLCYAANRTDLDLPARFADPSVRKNVEADLVLIDAFDEQIRDLELYLTRAAKVDDPQAYHRLRTIPGGGPVLALIFRSSSTRSTTFAASSRSARSCPTPAWCAARKIGRAHV